MCWLEVSFSPSEDSSLQPHFLTQLQTYLPQPSTRPFPVHSFPSLSQTIDPITCLLTDSDLWKAMEGVSLQLPPASLQADICCSNLSAVHSLTLSLICFFIFPLWYAVGIPRKILKEHGSVLIAPSQQSPPLALRTDSAHIWECKAEKWGAVFPVASLWLRLWSTWPESNYKEGGRQDALSSSFGSSEKSPHTWHFYHQVQKYKKVHSKAHQKEIWGIPVSLYDLLYCLCFSG